MDRLIPDNLVSRLNTLEGFLRSNILGQDEVLGEIVALLQRGFCELRFPNRPVASMLFLGPTGVGKTETCNLSTRHLFGSDDKLIRLDMSEYQEQRSIGVLLGADLGERGLLGHYYDLALRTGVLLLDEIEGRDCQHPVTRRQAAGRCSCGKTKPISSPSSKTHSFNPPPDPKAFP